MLRFPAEPLKPSWLTIITKLSTGSAPDAAIGAGGQSLVWVLPIAAMGEPIATIGSSTATMSKTNVATAIVLFIVVPHSAAYRNEIWDC